MASQRKLPDERTLRGLVDRGQSDNDIGKRYGTSAEAVRQRRIRYGIERESNRTDHSRFIPWKLRADHVGDVIARRLRAYSKRQQGRELLPDEERLLEQWITYMEGGNPTGVPLSVHYLRTDSDGFWLEPRQAGDRDFISPPK